MVQISWFGPIFGTTGFPVVARKMISEIARAGFKIKVIDDMSIDADIIADFSKEVDYDTETSFVRELLLDKPETSEITIVHRSKESIMRFDNTYNVGYIVTDENKMSGDIANKLNCLNEIWTPSKWCKSVFRKAGVKVPIYTIPHGVKKITNSKAIFSSDYQNKYKFITVVSNRMWRKGTDILLKAYFYEFNKEDNVVLVIKGYGLKAENELKESIKFLLTTERYLMDKRDKLPEIIFIGDMLTEEQLQMLYNSSDCLVAPYRGEAWGLTISDAMSCGLPTIVPKYGGCLEYCSERTNLFVSCSIGDTYCEPNVNELRELMKYCYENKNSVKEMGMKAQSEICKKFSWNKVGKKIMRRLDSIIGGKT